MSLVEHLRAQCTATFRALDKCGLSYVTVDISADLDARDYLMSLGYLFS